jgi:hypothetical protein
MRKIFCYTDSLLELFYKDFERDCSKFFRASKVGLEHMDTVFQIGGENYKIIGQVDGREMACRNLDTGGVWAIDRIEVQRAILGETNVDFTKDRSRKLKPLDSVK